MNIHIDHHSAEDKIPANNTTGTDQVMDMALAIKTAVSYHRAGKLHQAENVCKNILAIQPDHADAIHILGVVAHQKGSLTKAVALIDHAIHLNPEEPSYYNSLANILTEQGKFDVAIGCYQRVLQAAPGSVAILNNLGHAHEAGGELEQAISYYRHALQIEPNFAQAHNTLGNALKRQGKLSEAIASYQNALQIKPDFEEAQNNMGNAYYELGDHNNAVSFYQSALQINPDNTDAHNNLANVRKEQGKLEEAITYYQKAIELKADNAQAHNNMGIALKELGRLDDALRCFKKALQISPDLVEVHNNMGVTFKELGLPDEALACFHKSSQMRPDAGIEIRTALMLPVINDSVSSIQRIRHNMDERINLMKTKSVTIDDPFKQIGTTNFYLAYHGLNNRHLQKKTAALHMHACPQLNCELIDSQFNPSQHARIKIGVISKFLYAHTIGRLNSGIIKHLGRKKFDVTVFRIPGPSDRVSEAIDRSADKVVILPRRLESARQIIADQKLNILFYLDIGMDPLTYFLAFARLAPVQCTTWGHPDTSGIPNMDYYISSAAAEPRSAQNHYSEQLVLLNKFAMYCKQPPPVQHIISKHDLGIPEDCHLYACVQSVFKVHPDFDHILGPILRQDPNALIVFFEAKHGHWTKLLNKRLKRTLPDVHHRIVFLKRLPEKDFRSLLSVADVLLDTPHFSGGYTSLLSFAGGVPIVTRPGEFMRGRLTYAFYRQMEIMDCVADNDDAYTAIALRLANDKAWNKGLRGKIKARAHVLFDDLQAVRELENFLNGLTRLIARHRYHLTMNPKIK